MKETVDVLGTPKPKVRGHNVGRIDGRDRERKYEIKIKIKKGVN